MAQKKPVTFEDLDLNRLPLPLVAALQKLEEETESFRKVHRLIDKLEVFVKLHTVAIVADVFDGEDVEPEVQGMLLTQQQETLWTVLILTLLTC